MNGTRDTLFLWTKRFIFFALTVLAFSVGWQQAYRSGKSDADRWWQNQSCYVHIEGAVPSYFTGSWKCKQSEGRLICEPL